jgi:uncharacterized membrane protein YedE/YeeE
VAAMIYFITEIFQETWLIILVFGIFIYFTYLADYLNKRKEEKE